MHPILQLDDSESLVAFKERIEEEFDMDTDVVWIIEDPEIIIPQLPHTAPESVQHQMDMVVSFVETLRRTLTFNIWKEDQAMARCMGAEQDLEDLQDQGRLRAA